jgi:hypothetical protein
LSRNIVKTSRGEVMFLTKNHITRRTTGSRSRWRRPTAAHALR